MQTDSEYGRRRFLSAVSGVAVGSLAGCSDPSPDTDSPTGTATAGHGSDTEAPEADTRSEPDGSQSRESPGITTSPSDPTAALDLREANVVGVDLDATDNGVRFDVTLYHDDDGEEGYANWWQVETLDGEQLGRRDLRHAHSTAPFTRSETIEVPADVDCVVVRGHDQTHEYGGQAMAVALGTGDTVAVRQGPEPESVSEDDCP